MELSISNIQNITATKILRNDQIEPWNRVWLVCSENKIDNNKLRSFALWCAAETQKIIISWCFHTSADDIAECFMAIEKLGIITKDKNGWLLPR